MKTILKPCGVPWAVSPTMSGLTLLHQETDSAPECTVVFGGGRPDDDGRVDDRRIELRFKSACFTRTGLKPDDKGIEFLGYEVLGRRPYLGVNEYFEWRKRHWLETGCCPDPNFYVATSSSWLEEIGPVRGGILRHYVIAGRDGYAELLAEGFSWREWLWITAERDSNISDSDVVETGEGQE